METIFEYRSLKLSLQPQADPDVVKLLSATIWGTPGGANYQHLDTAKKLNAIQNTPFVTLRKGRRLLGTFALAGRAIRLDEEVIPAWYIRYFSLAESLRISAPATRDNHADKSTVKNNLLKRQMSRFFDHPFGLQVDDLPTGRNVYYAFVELTNERSRQMCTSMGFEAMRKFSTLAFSRFSPTADPRVRRTRQEEIEAAGQMTREFYSDHSLFFPDHLFSGEDHFILAEEGKILAGVRAHRVHWRVRNLPGLSGKLTIKVVPHIPFLKRIFNPSDFHFLALEGIFWAPGQEHLVPILLESVLAQTQYHTALTWADTGSKVHRFLTTRGKLGLLHKLQEDVPADVIMRFQNIPGDLQEKFRERPVYISGYDPT